MPLNVIKPGSFLVAETILLDSLYNLLLKLRCVAFVWYSFWHNKAPHLLSSISYCLTNGVQFTFGPLPVYILFLPFGLLVLLLIVLPVADLVLQGAVTEHYHNGQKELSAQQNGRIGEGPHHQA